MRPHLWHYESYFNLHRKKPIRTIFMEKFNTEHRKPNMLIFVSFGSLIFVTIITQNVGAIPENLNRSSTFKISRHLVVNENYSIAWSVNDNSEINFKIEVRSRGNEYIGFGISRNGAMNGADIIILRATEPPILEDRHGVGKVEPVIDDSQDWTLLSATRNETHTIMEVSRALNTGDESGDVEITVDTLRLIWAYGKDSGDIISYHGTTKRGVVSVNFLDPDVETPSAEELAKLYNVWKILKHVEVPSNDTTYMCSFFKSPNLLKKQHIVGYGMFIDKPENKRHVHHADLYRCSAPPGEDPEEFFAPFMGNGYDCNYSPIPFPYDSCGLFELQWTIGGGITMFPDNLGMPLESGEIYMTEVHFDNPEKRSDLKIITGFNIYYTDLKETEVGQLTIGVPPSKTFSITIPPNSTDFIVSSHCPMDCTSSIPPEGITAFTYLLHSHLSGRKMKLRHFRNKTELPLLAKDDYFDFNYQNTRRFPNPIKIMPGDHLTVECTYDTNWKHGKVILGGRSTRDEMCQAFLLYYPRMNKINSCGSYHQQKKILKYMGIVAVSQSQGEIDATVTRPSYMAGLKYSHIVEERIIWSEEKRTKYQELIQFGGQKSYCLPTYEFESFEMATYPIPVLERHKKHNHSIWASANLHDYIAFVAIGVVLLGIIVYFFRCKKISKRRKSFVLS